MARAPFQVLVFPYRERGGRYEYALFRRADLGVWQGIAGGGEDDETPEDAARREALEEGGISPGSRLLPLESRGLIPSVHFADRDIWGPSVREIPEYAFGVRHERDLVTGNEHAEAVWLPFDEAMRRLAWESNRNALTELNDRLTKRAES